MSHKTLNHHNGVLIHWFISSFFKEHFAQQMAAQGPPPQMVGPPTSGSPMTSIGTPVSVAMQPPQPRMPGAQGSVRLTASARQEYEAYVQSRLRMRGPQGMPGGPRMPGPPPGVIPAAQPRMAIVVRLIIIYL